MMWPCLEGKNIGLAWTQELRISSKNLRQDDAENHKKGLGVGPGRA